MPVIAVRVRVLQGAMQMPDQPIRTKGQTFQTSQDHAEQLVRDFPGRYEIVREVKPKAKIKAGPAIETETETKSEE